MYLFGTAGEGYAVSDQQFAGITSVFAEGMRLTVGTLDTASHPSIHSPIPPPTHPPREPPSSRRPILRRVQLLSPSLCLGVEHAE